jgi:hypothetical protein
MHKHRKKSKCVSFNPSGPPWGPRSAPPPPRPAKGGAGGGDASLPPAPPACAWAPAPWPLGGRAPPHGRGTAGRGGAWGRPAACACREAAPGPSWRGAPLGDDASLRRARASQCPPRNQRGPLAHCPPTAPAPRAPKAGIFPSPPPGPALGARGAGAVGGRGPSPVGAPPHGGGAA